VHETIPGCHQGPEAPETAPMDALQINAVGSLLADLSARTEQLRGYL
jgi:hypothetical protein